VIFHALHCSWQCRAGHHRGRVEPRIDASDVQGKVDAFLAALAALWYASCQQPQVGQ